MKKNVMIGLVMIGTLLFALFIAGLVLITIKYLTPTMGKNGVLAGLAIGAVTLLIVLYVIEIINRSKEAKNKL